MISHRAVTPFLLAFLLLGSACAQGGRRGGMGSPEEREEMMRQRAQADTTLIQVPQRPPAMDLVEATSRARAGNRRVLVVWLPVDSLASAELREALLTDQQVSGKIAWEYEPLWASPDMIARDSELAGLWRTERDTLGEGRPAYTVLDEEGAALGRIGPDQQTAGGTGGKDLFDRRALFSFLLRNQAPYPDAAEILEAAEEEARVSDRLYFLLFTEGGCEPCDLFLLWLERPAVKAIWERTFVTVTIDLTRTINGTAIYMQNVGQRSRSAGLPLFAVKRANGRTVGDSFIMPEKGNVGFPWTVDEVEAFRSFLEKRVEAFTREDRTALVAELRAFKKEIEALTEAAKPPSEPPPPPAIPPSG